MGQMAMNLFQSAFKGKRVLVTGDTGFKGSWLALWLHELGADVHGFALPPQKDDDHFNLLQLNSIIRHVDGDIRNLKEVEKVFNDFKPEILFHIAAQAIVRISYQEPKSTFDTNVGGSVNILEAVRQSSSLKAVVYITSDKCYRFPGCFRPCGFDAGPEPLGRTSAGGLRHVPRPQSGWDRRQQPRLHRGRGPQHLESLRPIVSARAGHTCSLMIRGADDELHG